MAVRIGKITYADWVSLPFEGGWTDTFIFRIDALACIPPFEYAPLLKRMVAHTRVKRPSASLWIQVEGPGEWFAVEVRNALKGLRMPFAVTKADTQLDILDFSRPPTLLFSASQRPPAVETTYPPLSLDELRCLQTLSRMQMGTRDEIAALSGLPLDQTEGLLSLLAEREWVEYEVFADPGQCPKWIRSDARFWRVRETGLSLALRNWGVPKGIQFTSRLEENRRDIGNTHRHLARLWPAWLKAAWPQDEIWIGWSEVGISGLSVIPDALAWGRIEGYETLFWLEVGDDHKSEREISNTTRKRLDQAGALCARSKVRLVYTQLSRQWVHKAAREACVHLSSETAIVLGSWKMMGELPAFEWGSIIQS